MAILNIKWESEDEKEIMKINCTEKIEDLIAHIAHIALGNPSITDINGLQELMYDTGVAIRAYRLLFNEDLEYEIFPPEVIFVNLTTDTVIRTFTRKEVINND